MRCPRLSQLPTPAPDKTGWPWTDESRSLNDIAPDGKQWPRVSIITPSFNQAQYIEETIRSVILQGYPNLEYLIFDGGSKDGSVEIIKNYSPWIDYWVSEPDGGQSNAINEGLKLASGQLVTWINSDDLLCKNALVEQASRYEGSDNIIYVGKCTYIDAAGNFLSEHTGSVHCIEDLVRVGDFWRRGNQIVQPEVLFPRALALSVGGLNPRNHLTMDYEFWGRLLLAGGRFEYTEIPFGVFREHANQKTQDNVRATESLLESAATLIRAADCFPEKTKQQLLADLETYRVRYYRDFWRGTGRLARIGLPSSWVIWLRSWKSVFQQATP